MAKRKTAILFAYPIRPPASQMKRHPCRSRLSYTRQRRPPPGWACSCLKPRWKAACRTGTLFQSTWSRTPWHNQKPLIVSVCKLIHCDISVWERGKPFLLKRTIDNPLQPCLWTAMPMLLWSGCSSWQRLLQYGFDAANIGIFFHLSSVFADFLHKIAIRSQSVRCKRMGFLQAWTTWSAYNFP